MSAVLVTAFFASGYWITASTVQHTYYYLSLNISAALATLILLRSLRDRLRSALPLWVTLGVFIVAYYLKFYLLVTSDEFFYYGLRDRLSWLVPSADVFIRSFTTITLSYLVFCGISVLMLSLTRKGKPYKEVAFNPDRLHSLLKLGIPFLMVVSGAVMYATGASRMAAEGVQLPFRLVGILFYTRTLLIPALLMLMIWSADRTNDTANLRFGVGVLLVHAASDMLLRSSKGSLLVMFLTLMILFMLTGRVTKGRVRLFVLVLAMSVALWPIIAYYRYIRAENGSLLIGALSEAASGVYAGTSWAQIIPKTLLALLSRFIGADSLLVVSAANNAPLGLQAFSMSVTKHFTTEVMYFPSDHVIALAPSMLGWFYLVGGNLLVACGTAVFGFLTWIAWCALPRLLPLCAPVAMSIFTYEVFEFASGGVFDRLGAQLGAVVSALVICEILSASVVRAQTAHYHNGGRSYQEADRREVG